MQTCQLFSTQPSRAFCKRTIQIVKTLLFHMIRSNYWLMLILLNIVYFIAHNKLDNMREKLNLWSIIRDFIIFLDDFPPIDLNWFSLVFKSNTSTERSSTNPVCHIRACMLLSKSVSNNQLLIYCKIPGQLKIPLFMYTGLYYHSQWEKSVKF